MYREVVGDIFKHQFQGRSFIVHCCNDIGKWGKGFVLDLTHHEGLVPKWSYVNWYEGREAGKYFAEGFIYQDGFRRCESGPFGLGEIQVAQGIRHQIVNIVGQVGVGRRPDGSPPVDYPAIRAGLAKLRGLMERNAKTERRIVRQPKNCEVICPKFGCGLAKGKWAMIQPIIMEELVDKGIDVTVYTLAAGNT